MSGCVVWVPVFLQVRALAGELAQKATMPVITLKDLGIDGVKEVAELGPEVVLREVETMVLQVASSIMAGQALGYDVPNRSSGNQQYVPELDRIVLKGKLSHRSFLSAASVRKVAITTRVLQIVHEILMKQIHTTKRDLFYCDPKLFVDQVWCLRCQSPRTWRRVCVHALYVISRLGLLYPQTESDAVLDDVACMAGCTRTSLHVVASERVRPPSALAVCVLPTQR